MQTIFGAIMLATGLGLASVASAATMPLRVDVRSSQTLVEQVQYWRGGYCERLRRACLYKEERGEVGEGNCRRYRAECSARLSYCERLRRACAYKDVRGEVGYGNCRRYRSECRSGRYDRY
jgi:hypothetical protein